MAPFDSSSATPKATLTVKDIGSGWTRNNASVGGTCTLRAKKEKVNASLAFSDATLKNVKGGRDAIATLDYKLKNDLTLNSKYDFGGKIWTVGSTWDGSVAKRATSLKLSYSNKDDLIAGEATVSVAKGQKANVVFNQQKLLTAKYSYVRGDWLVEPSFSFLKQSPALAVTKKLTSKETLKLSYDIKSEGAAVEYNRKPVKVVLSSTVSQKLRVGKPTLAVTFEKVYDL